MCGCDGGAHDIMVLHKYGVHTTRSCIHQAFSATTSVRWKDLSAVSNVRYVRSKYSERGAAQMEMAPNSGGGRRC